MNFNEIIVNAEQIPGRVAFHNYEEVKSIIEQGLSVYKTSVYSPENLSEAEQDLKTLRKVKKVLTDKKKELETAYSMPIEEVKKQLDTLIEMVKEPLDILDKMIKDKKKADKKQQIMDYTKERAAALGEYADNFVASDAFFNARWLNITYKEKDWKADIDKKIADAADAFNTIQTTGGENKKALLGFYFDKLSLDGANEFLDIIAKDLPDDITVETAEENPVIGYKVLKIYGTERQMLQLMTQLDLSDMEFEEIEDGMPENMEELKEPSFDTFVAFDIEHTGTNGMARGDAPAEITEIGAVRVVNGQITETFSMLANPGRKIIPRVARLTNISDEMVADKPPVDEVIKAFKKFVGDAILVGHNIKSCDIPHISRAARRAGFVFDNAYLDTKKLAKKMQGKNHWEKITLPYLSRYYKVEQTEAHRAWCDAEANAYVYLKMKEEMK